MAQQLGLGGAFNVPSTAAQEKQRYTIDEWKTYSWIYNVSILPNKHGPVNAIQIKLENGNAPIRIKKIMLNEIYIQTLQNMTIDGNPLPTIYISEDGNINDYFPPFVALPPTPFPNKLELALIGNMNIGWIYDGTQIQGITSTNSLIADIDYIYPGSMPLYVTYQCIQPLQNNVKAYLGLTVNAETIVTPYAYGMSIPPS